MTIKALEWAWEQDIPRSERDVLMVLANAINKDHEFAFPGQQTIARKVRMSERHVRRLIRALEERGLVRSMAGAGKGRGRAPTRYFLACDHHTGETKAISPDLTAGHQRPLVNSQPDITAGHVGPVETSQADKGCPVHKKEPESLFSLPETKKQTSTREALDGRVAIEAFADAARRQNWVCPKGDPSDTRKKAIKARLRQHGMEGWRAQVALAETMPFLGGAGKEGWRMTLDWFCNPTNWTKIAEETYDRRKPDKATAFVSPSEWQRRLVNYEYDGSWSSSYGSRPGQPGYAGPSPSSTSSAKHSKNSETNGSAHGEPVARVA